MWDLLDENDDADGGQHALDDAAREVLPDDAGTRDAQHQLGQATDDHGQEEGFKPDVLDAVVHNHRKSCGRAGHAHVAAGDGGDNDAADDAGNQAGDGCRAGSQGDAEAEGKGDKENNDGRGQITPDVLEHGKGIESTRNSGSALGPTSIFRRAVPEDPTRFRPTTGPKPGRGGHPHCFQGD